MRTVALTLSLLGSALLADARDFFKNCRNREIYCGYRLKQKGTWSDLDLAAAAFANSEYFNDPYKKTSLSNAIFQCVDRIGASDYVNYVKSCPGQCVTVGERSNDFCGPVSAAPVQSVPTLVGRSASTAAFSTVATPVLLSPLPPGFSIISTLSGPTPTTFSTVATPVLLSLLPSGLSIISTLTGPPPAVFSTVATPLALSSLPSGFSIVTTFTALPPAGTLLSVVPTIQNSLSSVSLVPRQPLVTIMTIPVPPFGITVTHTLPSSVLSPSPVVTVSNVPAVSYVFVDLASSATPIQVVPASIATTFTTLPAPLSTLPAPLSTLPAPLSTLPAPLSTLPAPLSTLPAPLPMESPSVTPSMMATVIEPGYSIWTTTITMPILSRVSMKDQ